MSDSEKCYVFTLIREDWNGNQGKRKKKMFRFENDLNVGGLYLHLGSGFPGLQRVLSVEERNL